LKTGRFALKLPRRKAGSRIVSPSARIKNAIALCLFIHGAAWGESFRTLLAGSAEVSPDNPAGISVSLGYNSSVLIHLTGEYRFCRAVQVELSAPQGWLAHRGSLALALYANASGTDGQPGAADIEARRIFQEPVPNKIQSVYQIPLRTAHGLRNSPYSTVIPETLQGGSFPIVFRLQPVIKGLSQEVENMNFRLTVKPILGDEGAVRFSFRYPEQLPGRPFTLLVDDIVLERRDELLLAEGEHYLTVLSDDYRNENRRFMIEKARVLDLTVELRDPAPLLFFEGPRNAEVFLDNVPVAMGSEPRQTEPGIHEVMFRIGDYVITKTLAVQRGKTYRLALAVDINLSEE
jgi:hypothetical protein